MFAKEIVTESQIVGIFTGKHFHFDLKGLQFDQVCHFSRYPHMNLR